MERSELRWIGLLVRIPPPWGGVSVQPGEVFAGGLFLEEVYWEEGSLKLCLGCCRGVRAEDDGRMEHLLLFFFLSGHHTNVYQTYRNGSLSEFFMSVIPSINKTDK